MSSVHVWLARTVAVSVVLAGAAAGAESPEVWITMDRQDAARVSEALERAGEADALKMEADGPIVVARILEEDVPALARAVHEALRRCGGFMAHQSREEALAAAARERAEAPAAPLVDYTIDNGPVVQALMADIQEANVRATIANLSKGFFTRYHASPTGQQSALSIRDLWAGYAKGRTDVTVQLYSHPTATTPQPSVILTLHGTTRPTEVVVLGAHQDSINGATARAPGADDDASGVASLSEVIRVALASGYRPRRTVKFMAYAAEEVGLRGSRDIATRFKNAGVNVVGAFQLDMTNFKGPATDIALITDHTSSAQNAFLGQLVDTYVAVPRANSQCGYACSDHASWEEQGFVSSFPFEAVFGQHMPLIHSANDTLAQSGGTANHAVKFSKLAAAYVAELAKGGLEPGTNVPPVPAAGPDLSAPAGTTVTLSATASDADGPGRLGWEWLELSGPPVNITSWNRRVARFTPTGAGTYVFRVVANDGAGSAADDVTVTVTP